MRGIFKENTFWLHKKYPYAQKALILNIDIYFYLMTLSYFWEQKHINVEKLFLLLIYGFIKQQQKTQTRAETAQTMANSDS